MAQTFWACGSGSLAAALACAEHEEGLWRVTQAGGVLDVDIAADDEGFSAWIGGEVRLLAQQPVEKVFESCDLFLNEERS